MRKAGVPSPRRVKQAGGARPKPRAYNGDADGEDAGLCDLVRGCLEFSVEEYLDDTVDSACSLEVFDEDYDNDEQGQEEVAPVDHLLDDATATNQLREGVRPHCNLSPAPPIGPRRRIRVNRRRFKPRQDDGETAAEHHDAEGTVRPPSLPPPEPPTPSYPSWAPPSGHRSHVAPPREPPPLCRHGQPPARRAEQWLDNRGALLPEAFLSASPKPTLSSYRIRVGRSNGRHTQDHAPQTEREPDSHRIHAARVNGRSAQLSPLRGGAEFDDGTLPQLASEAELEAWRQRVVNSALCFARVSDVTRGMLPRFGAIALG